MSIANADIFIHFVGRSESPGVRNFFLSLGGQWKLVADYLGYTKEEVQQILQRFPESVESQVAMLSLSLSLSLALILSHC